jgi:hypothetical protein
LIVDRLRLFYSRRDRAHDDEEDRDRKADRYDALLAAARRWKRRAELCLTLHEGDDGALGYALRDLVSEIDLSEWERPATTAPPALPPTTPEGTQ